LYERGESAREGGKMRGEEEECSEDEDEGLRGARSLLDESQGSFIGPTKKPRQAPRLKRPLLTVGIISARILLFHVVASQNLLEEATEYIYNILAISDLKCRSLDLLGRQAHNLGQVAVEFIHLDHFPQQHSLHYCNRN
jgi:hypothetical protein